MDRVKNHFETEAQEFDEIIVKLIPHYHQMVDILIDSIPFTQNQAIRTADLGCGTGTIAKHIADHYPDSTIRCLDIAPKMITMAAQKLADHKTATFQVGDFTALDPSDGYNLIVSSLALHHLISDQDKRDMYQRIYDLLLPGGVFLNIDVVLAATDHLHRLNINRWIEYMKCHVPDDEIQQKWLPTYQAEDHPALIFHHLKWLKEVGFNGVDVIWKYFNFCVYTGIKS
ncbi:MAG: class I SAM-dependent methyltransferase [Candidatus Delongbacteria bacterium]|nr:class I SAM-dependent methyltransferase [Candidatus Delongbacteria bacterium]